MIEIFSNINHNILIHYILFLAESGRESYQSSVMNSYVSSSSIKNADDEDDDMLFTNNNDNDSSKEAKTNLGDIIAR